MKKKIGLGVLVLIELICIVGIYLAGGQVAPWIWNSCVFIIGPIASVALIIQVIVLILRICKKKNIKWNMMYIVMSLILAYPITIACGISLLTYPTNPYSKDTIEVINPVKDSVLKGGKNYKTHAIWPSECYAYDILKKPYNNNSKKLEDYGIYKEDVYAPISGTIIDLKSTEEDIPPNKEEFKSSLGNYIFMKVEKTGTYIILAHLEKDSIKVSVGDKVKQGEVIAQVGNSGTTSEPHLHFQHQRNNPKDIKILICSEGLPIKFIKGGK